MVKNDVIEAGHDKTWDVAESAVGAEITGDCRLMNADYARLVLSDPRLEILSIDAIGILFLLHARTVANHQTPSKPSLAMRVLRVQSARALRLAIAELATSTPPLIKEKDGCYYAEKLGVSASAVLLDASHDHGDPDPSAVRHNHGAGDMLIQGQMHLTEVGVAPAANAVSSLPKPELKSTRCPANEIFEMFTRICTDLPQIQRVAGWHPQRLSRLEALWKREPDLKFWDSYFTSIQESDFLCGRSGSTWRADFDWILKLGNFCKIIEGSYQNRGRSKNALFNAGVKAKPENYLPTEIDEGNEFAKMAAELDRSA